MKTKLFILILLLLTATPLIAGGLKMEISNDHRDWYYEKRGPETIRAIGRPGKMIQTLYMFKHEKGSTLRREGFEYKYPPWDGTTGPVNQVLTYLGKTAINQIVEIPRRNPNHDYGFTDPNYAEGEIIIFPDNNRTYIWKIYIRKYIK